MDVVAPLFKLGAHVWNDAATDAHWQRPILENGSSASKSCVHPKTRTVAHNANGLTVQVLDEAEFW